MLTAHLELAGDETSTDESQAKKLFNACLTTSDPAKCLAQAGAAAACASFSGHWGAAVCAMGAAAIWDKLFGPDCTDQGGIKWCVEKCTKVSVGFMPYCMETAPCRPVLYEAVKPTLPLKPGGCSKSYCQLPGMPVPIVPEEYAHAPILLPSTRPAAIADRATGVMATSEEDLTRREYPWGAITSQDPKTGLWHVAVPRAELAGDEGYVEVAQREDRPIAVAQLPFVDYLSRTGQTPWYKDWRVWAIGGTVVAGGVGLFAWKRRKRRKRR